MSKNLNQFWQFFMRQISIVVGKWPKIEKQSFHLVTLSPLPHFIVVFWNVWQTFLWHFVAGQDPFCRSSASSSSVCAQSYKQKFEDELVRLLSIGLKMNLVTAKK